MSSTRYDFVPYPWPVKPALLFLLGLPADASKQDYEKRWDEAVAPAASGEWAVALFRNEVARQQAQGKTYQQAWDIVPFSQDWRLGGGFGLVLLLPFSVD